jgi:hypothetical protein
VENVNQMNQLVSRDENGNPVLLLILEPGNVAKLKDGQPIDMRVEDLFPDGVTKKLRLVIHYSETPIADAKTIAKHANVVLDLRTPVAKKIMPHCAECKSTIEQLGIWKSDAPVLIIFCPQCGCTIGTFPTSQLPVTFMGSAQEHTRR